jgi:hypothetical protein
MFKDSAAQKECRVFLYIKANARKMLLNLHNSDSVNRGLLTKYEENVKINRIVISV